MDSLVVGNNHRNNKTGMNGKALSAITHLAFTLNVDAMLYQAMV